MEIVSTRSGPVFAVTVKPTEPLPFPLAPEVIVIHDADSVAVHVQPDATVTATAVPAPEPGPSVCDDGFSVAVQPPAWLIVNVCPAIVIVPTRAAPLFAAVE
jgi:hypothetical protein